MSEAAKEEALRRIRPTWVGIQILIWSAIYDFIDAFVTVFIGSISLDGVSASFDLSLATHAAFAAAVAGARAVLLALRSYAVKQRQEADVD